MIDINYLQELEDLEEGVGAFSGNLEALETQQANSDNPESEEATIDTEEDGTEEEE
jgi:hypothetical protein